MRRAAVVLAFFATACHRSGAPLATARVAPRAAAALTTPVPRTGPDISAYYRLPDTVAPYPYRWLRIEPPLNITVDPAGNPHLSLRQLTTGFGLIGVSDASGTTQILVDTDYISFRIFDQPALDAPCTSGTGAWYATREALMFCVPNDAHNGFVWARIPASVAGAGCTTDAQNNTFCPGIPLPPVPVPPLAQVSGEIVAWARTGVWQLQHIPFDTINCLRNGQQETSGQGYVWNGLLLTSGVWAAEDVISCTYQYAIN